MTRQAVVSTATARKPGLRQADARHVPADAHDDEEAALQLRLPARIRAAAEARRVKSLRGTLTVTAKLIGGRAGRCKKVVRIRL